MKLSTFLTLNAVLFIPFGIGMLLAPTLIFPLIDVILDNDGMLMARFVGSMLFAFGLICGLSRGAIPDSGPLMAVLMGNLAFHAIDSLLTFTGAISGQMNALGFMFSGMHFILAVGFAYYYFQIKKPFHPKNVEEMG